LNHTTADRYLTGTQIGGSGLAPVLPGEAQWISDSRIKLPSLLGRDLAPVAGVVCTSVVIEVNRDLPITTVPEFIAYARANPGRVNMATVGAGSLQQLCGEYFKMMTGIDMAPVHYRGAAQAIPDLIAGRVQVMFDVVVSSISYINSGQLRALAVATKTPHELLPGVPTIGEFVPGFEAGGWQRVCAPSKTPTEIIDRVNHEINAVLADAKLKARLAELGGQPSAGTPASLASSSRPRPTNGARWSAKPASNQIECEHGCAGLLRCMSPILPVASIPRATEFGRCPGIAVRRTGRFARLCGGHPRLNASARTKAWMAGISPAMTQSVIPVTASGR
jgi:hypothetical protein